MTKNVLIFYISRYSGHYRAAKAIERQLSGYTGIGQVKVVNALVYTNPILGNIITKAYIEFIKKKPNIWGDIYDNPEVLEKTRKARDAFQKRNMPKMAKLVESFNPGIIYCTQAYPCGMVAGYKKAFKSDIPLVGVLTDHAPHSYWLYDEVDVYVVPSEETKQAMIKKGVSSGKIRVWGIPIDTKFLDDVCRDKVKSELGLNLADPVVLIMGGSQGLGAIEDSLKNISFQFKDRLQILVITGKNRRLYRRLNRKFKKEKTGNIHIFSYVDDIERFMGISDLIITKAGGISTSEALAKNLPIIIVDPIPGQERMNTDYLIKEGAALEVKDIGKIAISIRDLFASKKKLEKMRANARRIAKSDSVIKISEMAIRGV